MTKIFFAVCLFLASVGAFAAAPNCAEFFESDTRKPIFVEDIDLPHYKINGDYLRVNELASDYDPSDLYIGFTSGGDSHAYMIYRGLRYDPGLRTLGNRSKVRRSDLVNNGMIVRLQDIPEDLVKTLVDNLLSIKNKEKSEMPLSCARGVCNHIREIGVAVNGFNLTPGQLLRNLLTKKVKMSDGRPLRVSLYLVNANDLKKETEYLMQADSRVVKHALFWTTAQLGVLSLIGGGLYLVGDGLYYVGSQVMTLF
jgi:hypothetical protein